MTSTISPYCTRAARTATSSEQGSPGHLMPLSSGEADVAIYHLIPAVDSLYWVFPSRSFGSRLPVHLRGAGKVAEIRCYNHHHVFHESRPSSHSRGQPGRTTDLREDGEQVSLGEIVGQPSGEDISVVHRARAPTVSDETSERLRVVSSLTALNTVAKFTTCCSAPALNPATLHLELGAAFGGASRRRSMSGTSPG